MREGRPHIVPPAPLPLEEAEILSQLESDFATVMWKALRDVRMWAGANEGERRALFQPPTELVRERFASAREQVPELADAIDTFALLPQAPDLLEASDLAAACHAVHQWADDRGMVVTALHFAEAAAYANPTNPARANFAARMNRRCSRFDRAGIWYLRAHKLAVRGKNLTESIWALLGYGAMMRDSGRFAEARRALERAARRAERRRRRSEAAEAHHDLFVISVELGKFALGVQHATKALHLFKDDHPNVPAFGHDLAFLFIRKRHFTLAASLLTAAIPRIRRTEEQAIAWSSLAWAHAGAGNVIGFRDAERRAIRLVALHQEYAPAIFIHLAEGCRALGDWTRAQLHAETAADFANRRGMPPLATEATELRAAILVRAPSPTPAVPSDSLHALCRQAIDLLERWKPPNP